MAILGQDFEKELVRAGESDRQWEGNNRTGLRLTQAVSVTRQFGQKVAQIFQRVAQGIFD